MTPSDPTSPYLSLIFPAYNEARTIQGTLELAFAYLRAQGYDFEIIVAADGDDGTREAASAVAATPGTLHVIGQRERGGKGRGVRSGVEIARGSIIGFSDADNKTPIEDLADVLPWFDEGYDIVMGSRALSGSQIGRKQPLHRQLGSHAFRGAMHLMTGLWGIGDTQCGFKFFRADVAHDIFRRQHIDGYMFDVEILTLATASGYRIKQIPVHWRDDGDSRLELVAGNWRNGKDLVKIAWQSRVVNRLRPQG